MFGVQSFGKVLDRTDEDYYEVVQCYFYVKI